MIKQKQLTIDSSFLTCLCSLLDIDIKKMNVEDIEYISNFQIMSIDYLCDFKEDIICIASGFPSLQHEIKYTDIINNFFLRRIIDCPYVHNVIWKRGSIFWDPHPNNIGIILPPLFHTFIIPKDLSIINISKKI